MSLRNRCLPSATVLAVVIVPLIYVTSFTHRCLGIPLLHGPATVPCIGIFDLQIVVASDVAKVVYVFDDLQKYTANSLVDGG